ncbi:MAG: DNA-3-methyladenine glycosylase [Pirellulales bacterium]
MSLAFDPAEAVAMLCQADKRLAKVIARTGPFTMQPEKMRSPFESLLRAIVYQQLSGKAAATIYGRVQALLPGRTIRPEALLQVPQSTLRTAGMSRAKTLAAHDLAAKALDGTIPSLAKLRKMEDQAIIERLTAVRGVGVWTVEMLLIFKLGRPDVLPLTDLGVRKGFMRTYARSAMPTAQELLTHGDRWRPFRSVASWYLWRAIDQPAAFQQRPVAK